MCIEKTPALGVRVKRVGDILVPLPRYQTQGSAGMDLHAAMRLPLELHPLERWTVPTGLSMAIPEGWEGQIRPRSGLACRQGVTVANAPGTVDSDYRGEIKVTLVNLSLRTVTINPLDRIAQIVFARHGVAEIELVTELDETKRGDGGYGSTGVK